MYRDWFLILKYTSPSCKTISRDDIPNDGVCALVPVDATFAMVGNNAAPVIAGGTIFKKSLRFILEPSLDNLLSTSLCLPIQFVSTFRSRQYHLWTMTTTMFIQCMPCGHLNSYTHFFTFSIYAIISAIRRYMRSTLSSAKFSPVVFSNFSEYARSASTYYLVVCSFVKYYYTCL